MSKQHPQNQFNYKNQMQWGEFDRYQEDNLGDLASQIQKGSNLPKEAHIKVDKKKKKSSDIKDYQESLRVLRKTQKFYKPFQKITLNLSTMQSIKMLKDAIQKDKQFTNTLRNVGCKTRMRARNKTAARELFEIMLKYLQQGVVPQWMVQKHKQLLLKDQSRFNGYLRLEQNDYS